MSKIIGVHTAKLSQTILSTVFTSATVGSYIAIPGLSASVNVKQGQKVLIRCAVAGQDLNNYLQMYHIYRDGVQLTPNGPNTGYTPSSCYAYVAGGNGVGAGGNCVANFEFLDTTANGTHTYQVYTAKPSVAITGISINTVSANNAGSSSITLQVI